MQLSPLVEVEAIELLILSLFLI